MGAPCYKLEGNMGDDSDGCQMACLCPIGAGELAPTFYDDALAADFTDQCFQATTVSTSWTPSLKQVNTLVSTLVEAGKDSAQQAANCDGVDGLLDSPPSHPNSNTNSSCTLI